MQEIQRPPLNQKIIYALGQLGWSLASFSSANVLSYFYMPPEQDGVGFPDYIYQGSLFGIATVLGIIAFSGRLFDAVTDPMLANYSDKAQFRFGKRKTLMAISALPFALFSFLMFFPFFTHSLGNTVQLFLSTFLFFLSMTAYVIPYTALISELGHYKDDSLQISTFISVTWAIGFVLGGQIYFFQAMIEKSFTLPPEKAFQSIIAIYAIVALLFMLLPVFFLNENKYALQKKQALNLLITVKKVFKNINFVYFVISDLMYWFAVTFIQIGVIYYITILLNLEKSYASLFSAIGFLLSLVLYIPISRYANKIGKKRILIASYLCYLLLFAFVPLLGKIPLSTSFQFYTAAALVMLPLAAFGILPNVMVADIVRLDNETTGTNQTAMYFAVRAFMMKIGITIANFIFPSLLLLGKSVHNDFGIRITGVFAFALCCVGLFFLFKYKEQKN